MYKIDLFEKNLSVYKVNSTGAHGYSIHSPPAGSFAEVQILLYILNATRYITAIYNSFLLPVYTPCPSVFLPLRLLISFLDNRELPKFSHPDNTPILMVVLYATLQI